MSPELWVGALTLVVAAATLYVVMRHNRLSGEDVGIRVMWTDRADPDWRRQGEALEPEEFRLSVSNLGGSRSPRAELTVTLSEPWKAIPSPG